MKLAQTYLQSIVAFTKKWCSWETLELFRTRDFKVSYPNFESGKYYHYIFNIFQLWLTSHPRSTVVLLDTETPGTSREIESAHADNGTQTRNPSVINQVLSPLN